MHFKRLFTFGCSFTKYHWPTWADIIAHDLKIPYYNYAGQGLGNVAIYSLMLEADLTHTFTDQDLILVCWSGWSREDKFLPTLNGWFKGRGNVLTNNQYWNKEYIKNHWSMENDLIKNYTAIISANRMFNIDIQLTMTPFATYENSGYAQSLYYSNNTINDIIDLYQPSMPEAINLDTKNYRKTCYNGLINDPHPDILDHYNIVKDYIYPKLNLSLNLNTKNSVDLYYQKTIRELQKRQTLDYFKQLEIFVTVVQYNGLDFRQDTNFKRITA